MKRWLILLGLIGITGTAWTQITLSTALDNATLTWTTGGSAAWIGQATQTHDGVDAAQAGGVADGQESWFQTTVTGPGVVSFWWKVSSEGECDFLEFYVGGVLKRSISGEVDWRRVAFYVPAGSQVMRWRYTKDYGNLLGTDRGWVDSVVFSPNTGAPAIVVPPVSRRAGVGGAIDLQVSASGAEPLAYQWYFNAARLANATSSTLSLPNCAVGNSGNYQVVVSNALGLATSSVAVLTVSTSGPVNQILLFSDDPSGVSPYQTALINRGQTCQFYNMAAELSFNVAVENADPARTLVIVHSTEWQHSHASVADFARAGGRVIFQYFYPINGLGVVEAFNATMASYISTASPVYNWGSTFFTGMTSPQTLSQTHALAGVKLQPLAGGTAVAGFVSSQTANQAAVVVGNANRTIYNGLLVEEIANSSARIQFAANEISFLIGAPVIMPPGSPGSVAGWGYDYNGQSTVPTYLPDAVAVSAGGQHSLALRKDGTVVAWGWNDYGQGSTPAGLGNVTAIAAGGDHNLVLRADGTVAAWGRNQYGQANVPAGLTNVIAIGAGTLHSLALKRDGTVVAWGYYWDGYNNVPITVPAGLTNVTAISTRHYHNLALKADGTVVAWAYNWYGQTNVPAGLANVVAIAAGAFSSMALKADGTVTVWGDNSYGQQNLPAGLNNVLAISSGFYHLLAVKTDHTVAVWGDSSYQGNKPAYLTNVVAISGGGWHSLALIGSKPAILTAPTNLTAIAGTTALFTVAATGTGPLNYQWQFNGANLTDATNTTVSLANVQPTNAGNYRAVVSNTLGAVTSTVATLTVLVPPTITAAPTNLTVTAGATTSFAVTATGTPPLYYQWQFCGTNMPGATAPVFTLNNVNPSQTGNYRVAVSNACGAVTSTDAMLTVLLPGGPIDSPSATYRAGQFQFALVGAVGDVFEIQISPDLTTWTKLCLVTNLSGTVSCADTNANAIRSFYRALRVP